MNSSDVKADLKADILPMIFAHKAVAVIRLHDSTHAVSAVEAILAGGVKAIEITLTTPNALQIIATLRQSHPEAIIGVGSALSRGAALEAIQAGAQFVVSPVMKPEIIDECRKQGVVGMIGAFTPTEILAAHEAGADIVKVFPADALGRDYFKAVLAPMPHLRIMPTGGVSLTNAGEWLQAGACAVGVGSALCDAKAVAAQNFAQLTENARLVMSAVAAPVPKRL
jgi:2-dehydro-3-deoxyphosphogluconate aldolase / (4S)-4-hydroxy-2-oxoglutarate aldolase